MGPSNGLAVLRLARLEDAYEDDRAGILDLLELVVRENDGTLGRLREACTVQNLEAARQHAHRLRGACANIGAEVAAATAEQLEISVREGSLSGAGELVDRLHDELEAVRAEVAAYGATVR